jgi:hypothetical protein
MGSQAHDISGCKPYDADTNSTQTVTWVNVHRNDMK